MMVRYSLPQVLNTPNGPDMTATPAWAGNLARSGNTLGDLNKRAGVAMHKYVSPFRGLHTTT